MKSLLRVDISQPWPLHSVHATRALESQCANQLPSHTLMQRAGLATARLALALAPHAQTFWIACGPGNNGGDGLEVAIHLHRWGKHPIVTFIHGAQGMPVDAAISLERARAAGVGFSADIPTRFDFGIDALLGIGFSLEQKTKVNKQAQLLRIQSCLDRLNDGHAPLLSVDVPSALEADTGYCVADFRYPPDQLKVRQERHTLSLLTLKPGLFTGFGRDRAGQVWFDDLEAGCPSSTAVKPVAILGGAWPGPTQRPHASHKGMWGDVAVVGGAEGMVGAAWLAASGALHGGAGRVFVSLLSTEPGPAPACTDARPMQPDFMMRKADQLAWPDLSVVCGCGAGEQVRHLLPEILFRAKQLVLDADALNCIARDSTLQNLLTVRARRQLATVLTPHPLEAARLLGIDTQAVQTNRLQAAQTLAQQTGCVTLLKGSGTVIAAPGQPSVINPSGNARLAIGGTGDVLAGLIGALLASGRTPMDAACAAAWQHGHVADHWPDNITMTATALARRL